MTEKSGRSENEPLYFLHTVEESWQHKDAEEVRRRLKELGLKESHDAALGEGVGGPGWETVI
jgi:adenosylcobinamide amidohydrolase